jgi:hypothetical protein
MNDSTTSRSHNLQVDVQCFGADLATSLQHPTTTIEHLTLTVPQEGFVRGSTFVWVNKALYNLVELGKQSALAAQWAATRRDTR